MSRILIALLFLCLLTCIIEIIPFLFIKNRMRWIRTSLLCNVITNPMVNIALAVLSAFDTEQIFFWPVLVALEIAVVIFEACLYYYIMDESLVRCVVMAIIANALSFLVGILVPESVSAGMAIMLMSFIS